VIDASAFQLLRRSRNCTVLVIGRIEAVASMGHHAFVGGALVGTVKDDQGAVIPARAAPKGAGFGVDWSPRTIQIQARISF
jgi:hypothetical protein